MAKNKEARGGAFDVPDLKTGGGNEQTIRGGSGTSMSETEAAKGGDFSAEKAANGYPSNK